jgi:hypothetical protein
MFSGNDIARQATQRIVSDLLHNAGAVYTPRTNDRRESDELELDLTVPGEYHDEQDEVEIAALPRRSGEHDYGRYGRYGAHKEGRDTTTDSFDLAL